MSRSPKPPLFTDAHAALFERRHNLPSGSVAHAYRQRLFSLATTALQDLIDEPPHLSSHGELIWPHYSPEGDGFVWPFYKPQELLEEAHVAVRAGPRRPPAQTYYTETAQPVRTRVSKGSSSSPTSRTSFGSRVRRYDAVPVRRPVPSRTQGTAGVTGNRRASEDSTASTSGVYRSGAIRRPLNPITQRSINIPTETTLNRTRTRTSSTSPRKWRIS